MTSTEAPSLGPICCVPNCINSFGNGGCAQFFPLPINDELCTIWKTRINNANIMHLTGDAMKCLRICEIHFSELNKSKWGLQRHSLPTIALPGFTENITRENSFFAPCLQLTINNLSSICRICYSEDDLYDISRSKYQNMTIDNVFRNVTNDKFSSTMSHPNNMCHSCIKLLIQSKLLLDQVQQAATVFDQLLEQQHCISVTCPDLTLTVAESDNHCYLQERLEYPTIDNGLQNKDEHYNSTHYPPIQFPIKSEHVFLPPSTTHTTKPQPSTAPVPTITTTDTTTSPTSPSPSLPGHSPNPIVMSYTTYVRTTRRSAYGPSHPHRRLDTSGGAVVVSYLVAEGEEGADLLRPSSVELPASSGRYRGVVSVPAISIRCNMDEQKDNKSDQKEHRGLRKRGEHFMDSGGGGDDVNDITQMLEVKMDVEQGQERQNATQKGGKVYSCEACNEDFTDKITYKRHRKEHNTKKYMCTICQATFNTGTECSKHKMSHTRTCEVCGKSIQRKCYMNHLRTHDDNHSERYEQVKLKSQKLCNKCGRVFKRRWAFHAPCHTAAAPGKYQCDQCPFRTHYHKTLKQHLLVHAPAGDQFVCATCGDCFGTEDVLNKHMKVQHLRSAKLFPCKWCPTKFETRYERTKHLTTDHGKKPLKEYHHPPTKFKCNYCSMTFVTADNLRLHLWSHPNATDAELELTATTSSAKASAEKAK